LDSLSAIRDNIARVGNPASHVSLAERTFACDGSVARVRLLT
jgi:hypothetical protein